VKYSNENSFKTLKEVADYYITKDDYKYFASYCYSKEKGAEKDAAKDLKDWLHFINCQNNLEQREIAKEITKLSYNNQDLSDILPYSLKKLLIDIFYDWLHEESKNDISLRGLGYLEQDINFYEKAYEINKEDSISILEIIRFEISKITYQVHQISDSKFIGTVANAKKSLNKIEILTEHLRKKDLTIKDLKKTILDTVSKYKVLLEKWEEYKTLDCDISFGEWYKQNL